ncbi:MAG: hypothetical protein FWE08_00655 [Oscillospiraceae bacterium]|nr:hypothetical protein [Oscillospiraceae bacterium]
MYFGMKPQERISLFLVTLLDTDIGLSVVVAESKEQTPTKEENRAIANGDEALFQILEGCTELVPNSEKMYMIHFGSCFMYQTRGEAYCEYDPDGVCTGRGLILYEKSKLLDCLYTFLPILPIVVGEDENKHPADSDNWKHYGIYTENSIIDVISDKEPTIEKIDSEEWNLAMQSDTSPYLNFQGGHPHANQPNQNRRPVRRSPRTPNPRRLRWRRNR